MIPRIWLALAAVSIARAQCIEVTGDRVRAVDIAQAIPAFSALPGETEVAISPAPGVRRDIRPIELSRVLRSPVEGGICVTRRMRTLALDEVEEALRKTVNDSEVRISVVDYIRTPVPDGKLVFPLSGLGPAAPRNSVVLWRGQIVCESSRTAPVWARVQISRPVRVAVARRQLRPGEVLSPGDVEEKMAEYASLALPRTVAIEQVPGTEASREISPGTVIEPSMLRSRTAVHKGDILQVVVINDRAGLKFDAKAETAGSPGDRILVRNPINGRLVTAVVSGTGIARIELKGPVHAE
jgi:flagella basal body P-ring formation protein FlgA